VFEFDTSTSPEVLIGRDDKCQVPLDPKLDTIAGILHARIERNPNSPSALLITDLNTRNGTYVNGVRVRGQADLPPNSSVVLGSRDGRSGPEFLVTIGETAWEIPAPAYPAGTRAVEPDPYQYPPPPPPPPNPHRYDPPPAPAAAPYPPPPEPAPAPAAPFAAAPARAGSRNWWEGQLPGVPSMQQSGTGATPGLPRPVNVQETRLGWPMILGIVGVLVTLMVAVLWIRGLGPSTWDARTVEQTYSKSVFATELSWKLVDSASGTQVYHWRPALPFAAGDRRRTVFRGRERALAFIRMPNGDIEPILRLGPGSPGNEPAGGRAAGSAVVVHSGGFALTDRRNAAPWSLPYEWPADAFPAILIDPKTRQVEPLDRLDHTWIPIHARAVVTGEPTVENVSAGALSPVPLVLDGHIETFRARAGGAAGWFPATAAAVSENSDMAVARLQSASPLPEIHIPAADPALLLGERVFVLGFDPAAPNGQPKAAEMQVLKAETSGPNGVELPLLSGSVSDFGRTGSAVFDSKGRLAGLLRVSLRRGTWQPEVVPIRQGRDLVRSDAGR
jgi:hypothetical protein